MHTCTGCRASPEDRILTMRLYYHEHVPHDYEPPMFKAGEDDRLYLPDSPVKIKVGDVLTPHHTYQQPPACALALGSMLHPSDLLCRPHLVHARLQASHAHPHERKQL